MNHYPTVKILLLVLITGALVGLVGFIFKNKVYQKADDLKVKEQELSQKLKKEKQLKKQLPLQKNVLKDF